MELVKEIGRIILLAVVSFLLTDVVITQLVDLATVNYSLSPELRLMIIGLLTTILKAVDKQIHTSSNKNTGFLGEKGLTGF